MNKTLFKIPKMDCSSEESMIRMKLADISTIVHLNFNLADRSLTVFHHKGVHEIEDSLKQLNLGCQTISSEPSSESIAAENSDQKKLLWTVLAINFGFFILEMATGLMSESMGLIADSLDMLADSFVYALSLIAVGGSLLKKKCIAKIAGYFQIGLASIGFIEVLRRFFYHEEMPDFNTMIVISILALVANGLCLYLLQKSKSKEEVHMKATMIFTSNDVIINAGVIIAGILVTTLHSNKPDLIIGSIVFVVVIQGALRILKLSN